MPQDTHLQLEVLAELDWEPSVKAGNIGVTVSAGVVTLTGMVESYAEKHAAEVAARRVKGVLAVAQEIAVQLPFERQRGDADIAAAALERFAWDVSIPRDSIGVKVEQGWVSLTGETQFHYQRAAAEQGVRGLHGVTGVTNLISMKPGVDTANLTTDITAALHRSWVPDADAITVTAHDGKVCLTGNVHSHHARQVAGETAWGAPGTMDVENLLAIL
jgi:osmotically-inducible protein OsmY